MTGSSNALGDESTRQVLGDLEVEISDEGVKIESPLLPSLGLKIEKVDPDLPFSRGGAVYRISAYVPGMGENRPRNYGTVYLMKDGRILRGSKGNQQ